LRAYVLRRLGFAVLMLIGVSMILFALMRLAPGGPEAVLIGGELSADAAAQIRRRLGLDRPLAAQYATWAGAALRGDFGRSFKTGDPVAGLIVERLGPTLQLTGGALVLALAVAVPLGVVAAVRRGTVWDTLGSAVSCGDLMTASLLASRCWRLPVGGWLSAAGRWASGEIYFENYERP